MVEFVPLDLIGKKNVDQIIDIGDGGGEDSEEFFVGVIVGGATAGEGSGFRPGSDILKAGFMKDLGSLAKEDFLSVIDSVGEALDRIDKSGKIDLGGVRAKRVKEGFGLEMVVLKRVESKFEGAF